MIERSSRPIKTALLDQSVIAGGACVGVCDVLKISIEIFGLDGCVCVCVCESKYMVMGSEKTYRQFNRKRSR